MTAEITFPTNSVTYDKFVTDIAAKLASFMKEDQNDAAYISQRKAIALYGKGNIERWKKSGAISPVSRPGKIEYNQSVLKELSRTDEVFIQYQITKKKK